MSSELSNTPIANRIHISFFGRRNAGKSSIVNAVTGQELSIVSEIKGTTTDPVSKAMELLPLGPVLIIDTPGIDDEGELGELRIKKTKQILNKTDVAVLVVDGSIGLNAEDYALMELFCTKNIPYLVALNKCDLNEKGLQAKPGSYSDFPFDTGSEATNISKFGKLYFISVSAAEKTGINELKEQIAALAHGQQKVQPIIQDKLSPKDVVILVTPIDSSAPKGRMILPQVQTIRDILDGHALCFLAQTDELADMLTALKEPPKLVITDSQVFNKVKEIVPETIPLTSFSILFARVKGILETAANGALAITTLKDGDSVLMAEGCTHHRQCEDIGTVKLPAWIKSFTGKKLLFHFVSGTEFPEELSEYALVVHCGGCMLNEREVKYRMSCAEDQNIPFTNYGTLIAHINGILERSLEPF